MTDPRDSKCVGCELDAGVWYCAVHGCIYFCTPKMTLRFDPKVGSKPLAMMQKWMDRMEWPLTTLPINGAVYIPERVVLPQENDFGSFAAMFRWMDLNGIRRRCDK